VSGVVSGTLLKGRYRIDELLGEGGMGHVWRGVDLQLGRTVAIKTFADHVMARPDAVARFEREARVGAALGHPNIVHTYDFGEHAGHWFLVMQLVTGGSLLDYRLRRTPLPASTILAFAGQLADALVATHAIGLVHRDLKPENVLCEETGDVPTLRVTDFGMAFIVEPTDAKQGRLTMDGTFGGTPEYMAPEQISGALATPASDVYALGCMLFELALDRTPFQSGGVGRIFAGHLYAPPPSLTTERADLPPAFEELVHRMLAKVAADRPSAENVRRRIAMMEAPGPHTSGRFGVVSDRRARMITSGPPIEQDAPPAGRVRIEGPVDDDVVIALRAAGLELVDADADVEIVLGASLEDIAPRTRGAQPVIADALRGDFQRISSLLRIGVADVALLPIVPASLVRVVTRVLRKQLERVP
jgi:serine/threonine protein kinase